MAILDSVLIPNERIKIVKDKKFIDKLKSLSVKLSFDENCVSIEGEVLELFQAKTIVKAIGRGFSPENALRLLNEDENLETIELNQFTDNRLKIVKARLIGTGGKTWRMIENLTGCSMSVYGKTVSLIGTYEQLEIAREAVKMIIRGSKHSNVYAFLFQSKP